MAYWGPMWHIKPDTATLSELKDSRATEVSRQREEGRRGSSVCIYRGCICIATEGGKCSP